MKSGSRVIARQQYPLATCDFKLQRSPVQMFYCPAPLTKKPRDSCPAHCYDDVGVDQTDDDVEPFGAGFYLGWLGSAVVRRSAITDVGDVDIVSDYAVLEQQRVK